MVAVAEGLRRIRMDFEDETVGAGGDCGAAHGGDERRVAGAVTGIDDDR